MRALILVLLFILSGCNNIQVAAPSGAQPTAKATPSAPEVVVSPSPLPSVTPSPIPSPSASPTPPPVPYAFSGGSGSTLDPFQLNTAEDVDHIRDFPAANFILLDMIDMRDIAFKPIPDFSGTLLCSQFTGLDRLTITTTDDEVAAMFEILSGRVDGLILENIDMVADTYATGIAGTLTGQITGGAEVSGYVTSPAGTQAGLWNAFYNHKSGSGSISGSLSSLTYFNGTLNTKTSGL